MGYILAKCPACGADIQLDNNMESGFCAYCGARMLLEEAIPKKITIDGVQSLEQLCSNAQTFLSLNEYAKAESVYKEIIDKYPRDYRGWWGIVLVNTNNLSRASGINAITESNAKNAFQLSQNERSQMLQQQYLHFVTATKRECEIYKEMGAANNSKSTAEYRLDYYKKGQPNHDGFLRSKIWGAFMFGIILIILAIMTWMPDSFYSIFLILIGLSLLTWGIISSISNKKDSPETVRKKTEEYNATITESNNKLEILQKELDSLYQHH